MDARNSTLIVDWPKDNSYRLEITYAPSGVKVRVLTGRNTVVMEFVSDRFRGRLRRGETMRVRAAIHQFECRSKSRRAKSMFD